MKKLLLCTMLLLFFINLSAKSKAEIARVYINKPFIGNTEIPGHVYFDGFDFKGYDHAEDGDIQSMLDATLTLLENEYGQSKHPFVFVGHSQGGLRALAMSTYLKEQNPELYKQLKGVITLSGIDKGLKLLENQGAVFRSKLHADINILSNDTVTQWLGLEVSL